MINIETTNSSTALNVHHTSVSIAETSFLLHCDLVNVHTGIIGVNGSPLAVMLETKKTLLGFGHATVAIVVLAETGMYLELSETLRIYTTDKTLDLAS